MATERMPGLEDALSAAYDKVEDADAPEKNPGGDQGLGDQHAAEVVEQPDASRDQGVSGDRARDEQGRFAKEEAKRETLTLKGKKDAPKEQERPADKEVVGQPAAQPDGDANRATQLGADAANNQRATVAPPPHWLGAAKKHWDRLPAEVRESIHNDHQQFAQVQGLTQAISPYAQTLVQEFGGPDRGLAAILSTWSFARQQPLDFVKQFLQHRNIDPRMLAGEASPADQQQVEPGEIPAPVLQRMQQLEAVVAQVQQAPLIAQQNQIQTEIQAFQNAIGNDGRVAHPYFNDVKQTMAALMTSGTAKTLQDAYDTACWASPTIRAERLAADQARQAEERRRAAEVAKGAAASIAGSPGHRGPGQAQNETAGQTLDRVYDQLASGGRA